MCLTGLVFLHDGVGDGLIPVVMPTVKGAHRGVAFVNGGWFARFSSRRSPLGLGGELLGPWRDWPGDDRYAGRYGPEGTRERPLPLIRLTALVIPAGVEPAFPT